MIVEEKEYVQGAQQPEEWVTENKGKYGATPLEDKRDLLF